MAPRTASRNALRALDARIIACRLCPRLLAHCRAVAGVKRRAYRDEIYWGRPVPGFGDPAARLLVVGLAPGAHGANRTGRMFTGDGAGQTLMGALHRAGFASLPYSLHSGDGLVLTDCFITAAVRCAPPDNAPRPDEIAKCRRYLRAELTLLSRVQVVVALGALGHAAVLAAARDEGVRVPRPQPRFAHGAEAALPWGERRLILLDSFHPSRQNTQTGRLTSAMLEAVFHRAGALIDTR